MLTLDPAHVNAAYARAACHNRKGNFAQAIDDYNLAFSRDRQKVAASPAAGPGSPGHQRKGSFRVGVENYLKQTEAKARRAVERSASDPADLLQQMTVGDAPGDGTTQPIGVRRNGQFATPARPDVRKLDAFRPSNITAPSGNHPGLASPAMTPVVTHNAPGFARSQPQRPPADNLLTSPEPASPMAIHGGTRVSPEAGSETSSRQPEAPNGGRHSHSQSLAPHPVTTKERSARRVEADKAHSEGFAARKRGDFDAAIAAYSRAIALDPQHFKAFFNRGFAYDKLRQFELAVSDYTRALEIDPHNAYAYYNRGISYDRSGTYHSPDA